MTPVKFILLLHVSLLHSFLIAIWYSLVQIYNNLLTHSYFDRHLNDLQFQDTVSKPITYILVNIFFAPVCVLRCFNHVWFFATLLYMHLFLLCIFLWVELLDITHIHLTLLANDKCFFKVVKLIYIHIDSIWKLQVVHILITTRIIGFWSV